MTVLVDVDQDSTHVFSGEDAGQVSHKEAFLLGRRLQELAASQAGLDHDFCVLVDQFDAADAVRWFDGIRSTAHYIAWACSMEGGAAREHVRVARALREMPRVGRLSYSKVRELTRLVGLVDLDELCDLALEMTASQLARTVATYRSLAGTRIQALPKRRFVSRPAGEGMVRLSVVLPAEEAALITAAVETAARRATHQDEPTDELLQAPQPAAPLDMVEGLLDVAATYLDNVGSEPSDDHTLVMVHVSAESLAVPAGTSDEESTPITTRPVPLAAGICYVDGAGPIEAETAQRLMCTATVQGVVVDRHGGVLALGRTKRLATRAQRRALRVRDHATCQFPGCHRNGRLDAHHILAWSHGGLTDLVNMLLLCRRHHTFVHEGGVRIVAAPSGACRRHDFLLPDGRTVNADGWLSDVHPRSLDKLLAKHAADRVAQSQATAAPAWTFDPATGPSRIFPAHAGQGFDLHECVRVLFDITLDDLPDVA